MNTGNMVPGKAWMGAWLSYGLGSMNENLPTFVVLNSLTLPGTDLQPISPKLCRSGFLLNEYDLVAFRSQANPVLYLGDPKGVSTETRRPLIDTLYRINHTTFTDFRYST